MSIESTDRVTELAFLWAGAAFMLKRRRSSNMS